MVFISQPLSNCEVTACDRTEDGVAGILITDRFQCSRTAQVHRAQASCVGEGEERIFPLDGSGIAKGTIDCVG